jgi:hypothetical protein
VVTKSLRGMLSGVGRKATILGLRAPPGSLR